MGADTADGGALCCCQYVGSDGRLSHILGCCCNCEELDNVFTRFIKCRRPDQRSIDKMLIAFQDRLRVPWQGGAKRISPVALVPAIVVPLMFGLAALNAKTAIVLLIALVGFTVWGLRLAENTSARTTFFLSWMVFSILYMIIIFEFEVPLQELLPEENYILVLFSSAAIYCFFRTKQMARLNFITAQYGTTPKDELPGIAEASSGEEQAEAATSANQTTLQIDSVLGVDEHDDDCNQAGTERVGLLQDQPNMCEICRKYTPIRTYHCSVCGSCVKRRSHHSFWLNCCIGERNYRWYLIGLALADFALLFGANLTLTSVCHPFLIVRLLNVPLLLPDDCTEVFEDFELGICFVIASYAMLIAIYITCVLARQLYLLWSGATLHEYKRGSPSTSRSRILSNCRALLK